MFSHSLSHDHKTKVRGIKPFSSKFCYLERHAMGWGALSIRRAAASPVQSPTGDDSSKVIC